MKKDIVTIKVYRTTWQYLRMLAALLGTKQQEAADIAVTEKLKEVEAQKQASEHED